MSNFIYKIIAVSFVVFFSGISFGQDCSGESCPLDNLKKEKFIEENSSDFRNSNSSPNINIVNNNHNHNSSCKSCENSCQEKKVKVVYRDRIVYRDSKPKIIYRDRVVYRDKIVEQKSKVVFKPVYKYRTRVKEVFVRQKKERQRRHAVSLLGLATRTKVNVTERVGVSNVNGVQSFDYDVDVDQKYEADLGLMYQYDLRRMRLSIAGSLKGTAILGLGINF